MDSIDAARSFLMMLKEKPELQKQLTLVDWDETTAVRIASDMGFKFDIDDLLYAIDEQYGELTEEELYSISGGWSMPPTF